MSRSTRFAQVVSVLLLSLLGSACGAGSGGGSEGGSTSLRVSKSTLSATAVQVEEAPSDTSASILLRNVPDDGVYVILDSGENGIQNTSFFQTSNSAATLEVYFKPPASLAPGTYQDDLWITACYDEACAHQVAGSPALVKVTYTVEPTPTMSLDESTRSVAASLGQDAPPAQSIDVSFDSVPSRGVFLHARISGQALSSAQVIEVSPGTRRVQVSLPDPDMLGVGIKRGRLILDACLETPCVRTINEGNKGIDFLYRVAADPIASTRVLSLGANDMVFDPVSRLIYTVQSASAPMQPNSLAAIEPQGGTFVGAVATGNDPRLVAVSGDGSKFYVGLPASKQIERFSAGSSVPDLVISVPERFSDEVGQLSQIAVAPGAPGTIAVSRYGEVMIFDEAVRRTDVFGDDEFANADAVEWGDGSDVLYSSDDTTAGQDVDLYKISADASGATSQATYVDAMDAGPGLHFSEGRVFSDSGRVIDGASGAVLGTLVRSDPYADRPRLAVDPTRRLAYMVLRRFGDPSDTLRVDVFDIDTFARLRSFEVPGSTPTSVPPLRALRVMRWGEDGLAILNSVGQLILLQGPLVSAASP